MRQHQPPTEARLTEIEQRFAWATPEPWYEDGLLFIGVDERGCGKGGFHLSGREYTDEEVEANTKFIAHARADVPYLLTEVRRLRGLQAGNGVGDDFNSRQTSADTGRSFRLKLGWVVSTADRPEPDFVILYRLLELPFPPFAGLRLQNLFADQGGPLEVIPADDNGFAWDLKQNCFICELEGEDFPEIPLARLLENLGPEWLVAANWPGEEATTGSLA